jgi:hypothetical protein
MANLWGNPNLKSFKNNYIRRVIVDMARVFVHKNITGEVEELLIRAANHGAAFSADNLPAVLPAHAMDDSKEATYGLKLQIPNFLNEMDCADLGFSQEGDVFIYQHFSLDEAKPEVELETYFDEVSDLIGSKQIQLGHTGKEVKFLAYFLGLKDAAIKSSFDNEFVDATNYFQERMGIPKTGKIDWYTWQAIIPKGTERIAAGYAGMKVRALQSALMVNGYNVPLTSRFGTETLRAVRAFQLDNNLRTTGRVGFLEWNLLFQLK